MKKDLISLMIVAVSVLLIVGCAAKEEKVSHEDIKGHSVDIATGDFYEACDKWKAGDTIKFSFTSSKPVLFNVHYHSKMAKVYAVEKTMVDTYEGSFVVQTNDIHCCMWENGNSKFVTLTYDMSVEK
jgi:hypothetical protein